MKKLNLLLLLMTIFMASGVFGQTIPMKQIKKPEDATIRKIKTTNPSTVPVYKKPTTSEINAMVLKRNVYFTQLKSGAVNSKEGERQLTLVNNDFKEINQTTVKDGGVKNKPDEVCNIEKISINAKTADFRAFSMEGKPDWLKPGVMMKAISFNDGSNTIEEIKDRNPITFSTDLRIKNTSYEVMNPSKKNQINDGEFFFINQNTNYLPASMLYYYHEVHSLEELSFKLTGKYSSGMGAFAASIGLDYGTKKEAHYYMIEFTQYMFAIEVNGMDPAKVFVDPNVSTGEYIYLSKVKYGRKGAIIIKSESTLDKMGVKFNAKINGLVSSGEVDAAYESLKTRSDVTITAFYYGGGTSGAVKSIKKSTDSGVPDLIAYIEDEKANHKLALPIGYELKNLNNERVGLGNKADQTIETCIPKRDYKLKVTLTDIQNINGRDGGGDNPDDYGIQQYIVYTANGKNKFFSSRDINTFPERQNGPVQVPGMKNVLISGDASHQLHVREANEPINRNRSISNSLVFNISHEEFMDDNAQFKIYTWFKEYSDGKDKVLANNTSISVNIKEVLKVFSGAKVLSETTPFFDTTIAKTVKFHNFGAGNLPLANIQKIAGKLVLEGPIRIGNPGEKAAVWLQFELVD